MSEWNVDRRWRLDIGNEPTREVVTRDLRSIPVCCLLGAAGSGKTYELRRLALIENPEAAEPDIIRLASWAERPDQLIAKLKSLVTAGARAIYLDALDEALVQNKWIDAPLAEWIYGLPDVRPSIRISCRSTIWRSLIEHRAKAVYGQESVAVARIEPFAESEMLAIAQTEGVAPEGFMEQLRRSNSASLATLPLTLRMLSTLFRVDHRLPANRIDLFEKAISQLAIEREERRSRGTGSRLDHATLVGAAERLACYVILSGREVIDLGDDPPDLSALYWRDLELLSGSTLTCESLQELGRCGLFEADGPNRFRFIHRQLAEYLTGTTLAKLLSHQAKDLLKSPLGWRAGVAGPLQETAAFAAMNNEDVARWVAEHDPEVIGLSDVASPELRRMAVQRFAERFRRHELTALQVDWDKIPWFGLRYNGLEDDLRPILKERGADLDDLLAFAVALVREFRLSGLHEELTELALDPSVPMRARTSAGRTLGESAGRNAKRRLKPLIVDSSDDPNQELKGLALRCCWPEDLSTRELLEALTPRTAPNYFGSYASFLISLRHNGFSAGDLRVDGLRWATSNTVPELRHDPMNGLIRQIAQGSLDEIDNPAVGTALAELLLRYADNAMDSLLEEVAPVIRGDARIRRQLLNYLAGQADGGNPPWWTFRSCGLLTPEDLEWVLTNAANPSLPERVRINYAACSRYIFAPRSCEAVEIWLQFREIEPIRSALGSDLYTNLNSESADQQREWHRHSNKQRGPNQSTENPPVEERVRILLERAELQDIQYFLNLATEMWRPDSPVSRESPRLLRRTPGWLSASPEIRQRIVLAAERFLNAPTDAPERLKSAGKEPHHGFLGAAWLLLDEDESWADRMPTEWWARWSWLFLKACDGCYVGETMEQRKRFFATLHQRAPQAVRDIVTQFLTSKPETRWPTAAGPLEVFDDTPDTPFDASLAALLTDGNFVPGQIRHILSFLLWRDSTLILPYCLRCLTSTPGEIPDDILIDVGSALLSFGCSSSLSLVLPFLETRPEFARLILRIAAENYWSGQKTQLMSLDGTKAAQLGSLAAIFLREYPPENDQQHDGAFYFTPDECAIRLREDLISRLGSQSSREALAALLSLEDTFGSKYPRLRHPRSEVQRAYRRSHWKPIDPRVVAKMLDGRDRRLIRDEEDAVAGIVEALEKYGRRLRSTRSSDLEDLWNTPKGPPPSPKDEEHISFKLTTAVDRYFRDYAVVANREVQIFRRKFAKKDGGEPSSEVDILVTVPASGRDSGDAIRIPLEIKRSDNREAETGLREQLVERYMPQINSRFGVYVVVWFDAKNISKGHKPKWRGIPEAEESLRRQAEEVGGSLTVKTLVIDATLR